MADDTPTIDDSGSADPDPQPDPPEQDPQPRDDLPQDPPAAQTDTGALPPDVMAGDAQTQKDYAQSQIEIYKQSHARAEYYRQKQEPLIEHFMQQMREPAPERPAMRAMPVMPQEQKNSITHTVINMVAVAALAYAAFGSRRGNPYGQAAWMGGLGQMFSAFSQGEHEKAKDNMLKWHQLTEQVNAENKARLTSYKEIIANKKLDLHEQMDLIRMQASIYKDASMEEAAASKNFAAVIKQADQKAKALTRAQKDTTNALVPKMPVHYRQWVLQKTGGKLDPAKDDASYDKAYSEYPPSDMMAENRKTADEAARARAKSTAMGKKDAETQAETDANKKDPLGLGF